MTCFDYGCNQSANCPAREKLSEYESNRLTAKPETPPQYLPTVDMPHIGYFADFCSFVRETWRPVLLGITVGALIMVALFLNFKLAP